MMFDRLRAVLGQADGAVSSSQSAVGLPVRPVRPVRPARGLLGRIRAVRQVRARNLFCSRSCACLTEGTRLLFRAYDVRDAYRLGQGFGADDVSVLSRAVVSLGRSVSRVEAFYERLPADCRDDDLAEIMANTRLFADNVTAVVSKVCSEGQVDA